MRTGTPLSTDDIRGKLLGLLTEDPRRVFTPDELAERLGYPDDGSFAWLREVLADMEERSEVRRRRSGKLVLGWPPAEGILRTHPRGFGFVDIVERAETVRVEDLSTALHGDRVRVCWLPERWERGLRLVRVAEVLERARTEIVGTFSVRRKTGYVHPEDVRILPHVRVGKSDFNGARPNDRVVASIDAFADSGSAIRGRILRVIGGGKDARVRVTALARSLQVRMDFPDDVLREARAVSVNIPPEVMARRLDLRGKRVFTIDPADAKDLDDAVHVERLPNGNLEVGVHVADASHFVPLGSALDREAYLRGTSVYLVDRVVPMLPEELSNGVCSLHPHEDRLTVSCIMELGPDSTLVRHRIRETIVHAQARLTYEEAQPILDGGDHPLAEDIRTAGRLADALRRRREAEGSIDFDVPEIRAVLGERGELVGVQRKKRTSAHRLIEEWMLLANRAVAAQASRSQPFVYRIHGPPKADRIADLSAFAAELGIRLALDRGTVTGQSIQRLLAAVQGTDRERSVVTAVLRAMSKAAYSTDNVGHYGLGFAAYTHFTSPIRRYPDLAVHRLLKGSHLDDLGRQCCHLSRRERIAEEAERASLKLKQVEYAEKHPYRRYHGTVTGLSHHGVYVEFGDMLVEGRVYFGNMDGGWYWFDASSHCVECDGWGPTYRIGDEVRVSILDVNTRARTVDLVFE